MRDRNIVVIDKRRDVSLFHGVADRLDVAGAERDVIRRRACAGRVEGDRRGRCARRRVALERRRLELKVRFHIEVFLLHSHGVAISHAAHRYVAIASRE